MLKRFVKLLPWLALAGFALPLTGYAAAGLFMRYSGDDYCYNAVLAQNGFWGMQVESYRSVTLYGGNRFALNLAQAVAGTIGPAASAVLPLLLILLWVGGLVFAVREAARAASVRLPVWLPWLVACGLSFFTLDQIPDLSQNLLWRSGALTYLTGLIGMLLVAGLGMRYYTLERVALPRLALFGGLAVFASSFNEVGAIFLAGISGMTLAVVLALGRRMRRSWRAAGLAGIALAASLLALLVMALSPAIPLRQQSLPEPQGVLDVARITLESTRVFIALTARHLPLQTAAPFVLGWALAWLAVPAERRLKPGQAAAGLAWIAATVVVLIACVMAPTAYAYSSYPDDRTLMAVRFAVVLGAACAGWLAGTWLRVSRGQMLAGAAIALLLVYPLLTAARFFPSLPRYARWASYWDQRHALLLAAKASGERDVHVMEIDHIIDQVSELKPDPNFWYNRCAAWSYGLDNIRADLPGWDD